MEALGAALRKGSSVAARSDEDRIYEDFEAPKFVDFTVPDHSRLDDRSWFCARIGCDENHEEVDPDALYKSFVLRVMAARSPNVRLQKSLNRQRAPSANAQCPRSAPAKSVNGRTTKLGTLESVSEKTGIPSKLKAHPISSLRSTPNNRKAAKLPPIAEKALTTPRHRSRPPNQEPFRSASCSKARPLAPVSKTVVKALTFQTPKKNEHVSTPSRQTIRELSAGLKKIRIGSKPRAVDAPRSNPQARKTPIKIRETPENPDACRTQTVAESGKSTLEMSKNLAEGEEINEREPLSSIMLGDRTHLEFSPRHEEKVPHRKPVDSSSRGQLGSKKIGKQTTGNISSTSDFDEDKENTNRNMDSDTIVNRTRNFLNKNLNKPLKAIVVPSKTTTTDPPSQGIKYKPLKPTNPKPFRLRTDERGILREANLEKGKSQKEASVIKAKTKLDSIKAIRTVDHEMGASTQPMENFEEKTTGMKKSKFSAPVQSVAKTESVSTTATTPKERACGGTECEGLTNMTGASSQVKKAITIPREPVFHKIHIPRSCTKRLEKAN